ncbi:Uncharacterized protein Rs2_26863 [Raphanus sativus]|nr:Uncharacterized protein Rs2_26863 [Raphanus sativus]
MEQKSSAWNLILCMSINNYKVVGVLKYRVQLCVFDGTYTIGFVTFDGQMTKLINAHSAEVAQLIVNQREPYTAYGPKFGGPDQRPIPQCLKGLASVLSPYQEYLTSANPKLCWKNSSTDVAKVVLANHTGLQACGVIEEGSGVSSGSHDLLHHGGDKAESAELQSRRS